MGVACSYSSAPDSSYSVLLNSFALAYYCRFSKLWSMIEEVKFGVSDNGQKPTSRKTTISSLAAGARSVLVALWYIDDKATMVFMKRFYQHLKRR